MQEASITAQNTFTGSICPMHASKGDGEINYSISGSGWVGTVTIQRSFNSTSDSVVWHDVETFTTNDEGKIVDSSRDVVYRVGVKTGDYTSGTIAVGLYW